MGCTVLYGTVTIPYNTVQYCTVLSQQYCPWNYMDSMEFHGFHGIPWIPWNSMESMEFHGIHGIPWIPWNSMEFHGIHGIPWNPWNSMDSTVATVLYSTVQYCTVLYSTVQY